MSRDGCLVHEFIHVRSDPTEAKSLPPPPPTETVALTDQSADEMCWKTK